MVSKLHGCTIPKERQIHVLKSNENIRLAMYMKLHVSYLKNVSHILQECKGCVNSNIHLKFSCCLALKLISRVVKYCSYRIKKSFDPYKERVTIRPASKIVADLKSAPSSQSFSKSYVHLVCKLHVC